MSRQEEYELRLQTLVAEAVARGTRDLATLVGDLPGVFPVNVVEVLRSLEGGDQAKELRDLLEQACTGNQGMQWSANAFVPHPLDSDWRFTAACAESIAQEVNESVHSLQPARIALLGTATLVAAVRHKITAAQIWLLEKNRRWEEYFALVTPSVVSATVDLSCDDLPEGLRAWAEVVVIDPPWYESAYEHFLWAAANVSRLGGWLLTTLPGEGTRPSAQDDVARILHFATTLGYQSTRRLRGAVRYRTPPFEHNAIRAAGIRMAFPEWRSADLLVLRAERHCQVPRPPTDRHTERWEECASGPIRVKFRVEQNATTKDSGSPRLLPLVEGDILPSVSARHPKRPEIDVWTSGNRVFRCENTRTLAAICAELDNSNTHLQRGVSDRLHRSLDRVEAQDLETVASHLREIIKIERAEYAREEESGSGDG